MRKLILKKKETQNTRVRLLHVRLKKKRNKQTKKQREKGKKSHFLTV